MCQHLKDFFKEQLKHETFQLLLSSILLLAIGFMFKV